LKEQEAADKKSGTKLSYDEQKSREKDVFLSRAADMQFQSQSDGDRIALITNVLSEIAAKDKTYMSVLSVVTQNL